jgi:hypothetical protein
MGGGTQAQEAHRELDRWVQMKGKTWVTRNGRSFGLVCQNHPNQSYELISPVTELQLASSFEE